MSPPRLAEILLEGMIVDTGTRDALLGDLAEEHAERATRDGRSMADRWYALQAVRTSPSLFWMWLRQTPPSMLAVMLLGVSAVRLISMVAGAVTLAVIAATLHALGVDSLTNMVIASLGSAAWSFVAGWVVARIYRRAPIPAMLWLVATTVVLSVVISDLRTMGFSVPGYLIIEKVLSIAAAAGGAASATARMRRRALLAAASLP